MKNDHDNHDVHDDYGDDDDDDDGGGGGGDGDAVMMAQAMLTMNRILKAIAGNQFLFCLGVKPSHRK